MKNVGYAFSVFGFASIRAIHIKGLCRRPPSFLFESQCPSGQALFASRISRSMSGIPRSVLPARISFKAACPASVKQHPTPDPQSAMSRHDTALTITVSGRVAVLAESPAGIAHGGHKAKEMLDKGNALAPPLTKTENDDPPGESWVGGLLLESPWTKRIL
jgi:hypothetical protein